MIEFTEEQRIVLCEAMQKYGISAQILKAVEELAELQQAICKLQFDETEENLKHVTEELADVLIMIEQIQIIYLIKNLEIEKVKDFKITRLKGKIK